MKAAKDETYLSGRALLSEDGSNAEKVYNMQAGDDATHEAKLLRSVRVGLDELKSQLGNFINNDGNNTGDNISDTLSDDYDYFDIVLEVSTRFNKGYVDTLASLASSYITDYAIGTWWTAVSPTLAAPYYTSAAATLGSIKRCFIKMPPKTPVYKYAKAITVGPGVALPANVGDTVKLSYSLTPQDDANGKVIDDVMVESSAPHVVMADGTVGDYTLTRLINGDATVTLYSKHNPTVKATVG